MTNPIQIAKALLLNEKGELLLVRRTETAPTRPNGWDIPGGSVEADETPLQAVTREIKEEIGVSILPGQLTLMYASTNYYNHTHGIRFIFVGKLPESQEVKLSYEHDQYHWSPLKEALAKYDHPVYTEGIRYLLDNDLL